MERKRKLWNGSYFCETIGSTSEENILRYIERQKELSAMNKAIKYRVYPTVEQCVLFARLSAVAWVYNLMLSDKVDSYNATGKFAPVTPAMYKEDYPYLKEVDSLALANKQMDLQAAFRNCFSRSRKEEQIPQIQVNKA